MKHLKNLAFVAVVIVLVTGCGLFRNNSSGTSPISSDSGKLTQSKAQNALSRWVKNGTVAVKGIQEIPKENAAKVDVTFTNFKFKANTALGEQEQNYTGPGIAIFTHYNDGRWVLTKVSTAQGISSIWWDNLSVEAN